MNEQFVRGIDAIIALDSVNYAEREAELGRERSQAYAYLSIIQTFLCF